MNYSTWLKTPTEKRLTYTLGTQQTLRQSVISRVIAATVNADVVSLNAVDNFVPVVFSAPIRQNTTKIVVVRNAELISDYSFLKPWFNTKNIKIVFDSVATEFSAPVVLHGICQRGHMCGIGQTNLKTAKTNTTRRTCKECDVVAKTITYRGRFVDCSIEGTGVEVLKAVSELKIFNAKAVMEYAGSIDAALEIVEKHKLVNLNIDEKQLPVLSSGNSNVSYARELTIGDKFQAVRYAATVTDYQVVFDYLADWLINIELVARHSHNGKKRPEIATLTGLSWPQTAEYLKWVSRYNQDKIDTASVLLANAIVDWHNGAHTGLLQLLAMNW